jgi:putative transposase
MRYVERNPVRAGLASDAADYKWSSAAFHLGVRNDKLIRSITVWGLSVKDWAEELKLPEDEETVELIRARTKSGYPCGSPEFIEWLSQKLGRPIILRKRGRPRKE